MLLSYQAGVSMYLQHTHQCRVSSARNTHIMNNISKNISNKTATFVSSRNEKKDIIVEETAKAADTTNIDTAAKAARIVDGLEITGTVLTYKLPVARISTNSKNGKPGLDIFSDVAVKGNGKGAQGSAWFLSSLMASRIAGSCGIPQQVLPLLRPGATLTVSGKNVAAGDPYYAAGNPDVVAGQYTTSHFRMERCSLSLSEQDRTMAFELAMKAALSTPAPIIAVSDSAPAKAATVVTETANPFAG